MTLPILEEALNARGKTKQRQEAERIAKEALVRVGQAGSVEEKDVLAMLQAWGYAESQRSAFSSSGANETPKLSDNLGLVRTYTITATVNTPTTATTATAEAVRIALTPLEKNGDHAVLEWLRQLLWHRLGLEGCCVVASA